MMVYTYGLLRPIRAANAQARNASLLGPMTLGVEVTEPELAVRCGLGNVDPQHLGRDLSKAAIDAAVDWPLPPAGARLVTLRPDLDAVGAMAVLTMRARGTDFDVTTRERVALVSRADRFAQGVWPGPRPLPVRPEEIDEIGPGPQGLGAMAAGLALRETSLDEAVSAMVRWLRAGEVPPAWLRLAEQAAAALSEALAEGRIRIREACQGSGLAIIEGFTPGSLRLGYRRAPVVIAHGDIAVGNAAPVRKITIAQYDRSWIDLPRAARLLSEEEPGWGGSATIIGSPQGVASKLSIERCIEILQQCDHRGLLHGIAKNEFQGGAVVEGSSRGNEGPAQADADCWAYLFEAKGIQRYIFDSGPLRDLVGASDLVARLAAGQEKDAPARDLIGRVLAAIGLRADLEFSRRAGGAFCLHSNSAEALGRVQALWRLAVGLHCPGLEGSDSGPIRASSKIEALAGAYRAGSGIRTNTAAESPPTGNPFSAFNPRTGRLATRGYAFWDDVNKTDEVVLVDVLTEAQRRRAQALLRGGLDAVARRFLLREQGPEGLSYAFPRNLDPEEKDEKDNPLFPFRNDEDRRIAVIHADLSGLGEIFQNATDPEKVDGPEGVLRLAECIENAIEGAAQIAAAGVLLPEARARDYGLAVIPARPVLLGGDDITILVRADLAVPFARRLLEEIETQSAQGLKNLAASDRSLDLPERLSACAGIAVVKSGQPFLMANALAESLCQEAKAHAKRDRAKGPYPSFLAFHIAQSTLREEYGDIKERELTANGVELTANPYCVGSEPEDRSIGQLIELAKALADAPRGRGKLIEAARLMFENLGEATERWGRWRQVLELDPDDGRSKLRNIDAALRSGAAGDSQGEPILKSVIGLISDALELVDLGAVEHFRKPAMANTAREGTPK